MGLFERYLSVWIGLAIVAGVGLGAWFPDAAASIAALECRDQSADCGADLGNDLPDDAGGRLLLHRSDSPAAEGAVGDSRRELADQALHHDGSCLAVHPRRVFRLDPGSHRA